MAFTKKQKIFTDYLLKRIGFTDVILMSNYLRKLEDKYGRYFKEWKVETFPNGYVRHYWILKYSNSECIKEILKEIELKKDLGSIKLKDKKLTEIHSATDLANFNFCPVNYTISKSFEIEFPTNEDEMLIGTNLHENLRLINKEILPSIPVSEREHKILVENSVIKRIKKCELIFSGHKDEKQTFFNKEKSFIGQPDYIFKDPKGKYFVVEEKFKYLSTYINSYDCENNYDSIMNRREKLMNTFFENHIVQIQSYISYIKDYPIEYGVLIYWFYEYNDETLEIHNVKAKVIKGKEYEVLLEKTVSEINYLVKEKTMEFTNIINPNKCAACSVNKYCAHKTYQFKVLKMPYNRYDMRLKYVEFPEDFKK